MNDIEDTSSKAAAEDKNTERRIVALRLTEDDAALLRGALPLINGNLDGIVDAFCGHLLNYSDTRNTLRSRSRLEKLKQGLKNYLEETFDCRLDRDYFRGRANIAEQLNGAKLRPRSYLATYGLLKKLIRPIITENYKDDAGKAQRILEAIDKVFFLDSSRAISSYINNHTAALENARSELLLADKDWENTFNSITDMVSVHDKDFNIVKANRAVCERLGLANDDVTGKKCYEIFHGTDEPWDNCPLTKVKETLKPAVSVIEDPHMGGVFLVSAFPRFDDAGELTGVIQIARDITDRKKLELELERLSVVDELTGLYNRRRFHELLNFAIARSKRYGQPLSLLFFDLDDFKDYNDSYGHLEGDVVLKKLADCAWKQIRQDIDFCCRLGGEEFTVILPETSKAGARNVAERIRKEVKRLEFHPKTVKGTSGPSKMTISVGVAEFNNDDAHTLVDRADRAMYKAKRQGKNKTEVSD
ncbi:MAG: diguanylate cyclase [Planctomycetes bacterium]|nr:diguanylate cyclase [Planctomycetota bacterium]